MQSLDTLEDIAAAGLDERLWGEGGKERDERMRTAGELLKIMYAWYPGYSPIGRSSTAAEAITATTQAIQIAQRSLSITACRSRKVKPL